METNRKVVDPFILRYGGVMKKLLLIQLVITFGVFTSVASNLGQNKVSNWVIENSELAQALKSLSEVAGCKFVFNYDDLSRYEVSASLSNKTVEECLDILFQDKPFTYVIQNDVIVISHTQQAKKSITYTVKGSIVDEAGAPLPGVTIVIKSTKAGVATDMDGRFELVVPEKNCVLLISFVGMKSQEIVTDGIKPLKVILEPEATMLSEVVATGYQTISRERATGSAVILNTEKLDKIQASSLTTKLEGVTPGLSNYGGSMSIRGTSSFAVGASPLLVVDGQVVNQDLGSINPDDIESLTVLKDAAATSLYGVRASNGVIVVTTKRGKDEQVKFNISAGFYLNPLHDLEYQNYASTGDVIDYERSYIENDPLYLDSPTNYFQIKNDLTSPKRLTRIDRLYYDMAQGKLTSGEVDAQINAMRNTDYRKAYRKAFEHHALTQDYNLSVTKGGERSNIFFSVRYEDFGKYKKSDSANRLSLYLKNMLQLTDWFKVTYGMNSTFSNAKTSNNSTSFLSAMPYEEILDKNGDKVYQYDYNYVQSKRVEETKGLKFMGINAYDEEGKNMDEKKTTYLKFFAHTDFKLLKGLDLGLKIQYEKNNYDTKRYDEADSYFMRYKINQFAETNPNGGFTYHIPDGGHMSEAHDRSDFLNLRGQLNYNVTFGEKHDLVALVGGEIRQDKYQQSKNERYGYDDDKLTYQQVDWLTLSQTGVVGQLNNGTQKTAELLLIDEVKHRYVSAYANAGYTYDGRYTFNASVRVEQADLFGTDPKYRYRPLWSVGGSWNMSNENFLKAVTWVNALKLRATYGITGNVDQSSSPFLLGTYLPSPYTNANITLIQTPPNPMLRWEKTSTFNIGVDFSLIHRLNGSIEYYNRFSSDLLANKTLDPSLGFESARVNNGEMRNSGVEMSFSYDWIKQQDWALNTTVTAAYNKNTIEKVGFKPTNALDMLRNPNSNYLEGDSYRTIYAYKYAGLTSEGHPSIYDENGEVRSIVPVRNINALVNVGQLTPKWSGALNIALRWKTVELFTKFVYYTGHSLRNDVTPLYTNNYGSSMHKDMVDRWTPTNQDTEIPVMGLYVAEQDRGYHWKYADAHVLDASFIKCRNIGLSYALPKKMSRTLHMDNITLRAQINNPFYWAANNEGIDPEAFQANEGARTQALMTNYVFGLNIKF